MIYVRATFCDATIAFLALTDFAVTLPALFMVDNAFDFYKHCSYVLLPPVIKISSELGRPAKPMLRSNFGKFDKKFYCFCGTFDHFTEIERSALIKFIAFEAVYFST